MVGLFKLTCDMMEWNSGGWFWMGLMMIGGLIIFAVLIYLLFKGLSSSESRGTTTLPPSGETPLEIAQRRYASGEITQEEFERIKKDLIG
jgi:putative membrane protein